MAANGFAAPAAGSAFGALSLGAASTPWQRLNFLPLPQGQGSFLPTVGCEAPAEDWEA